jgi:hypothetical protein
MSQAVQETSLQVPVNTPALHLNGALSVGVQQNQVSGPPTNFEAFLNEVSLRLELVQAQPERQLAIWKYENLTAATIF